MPATETLPDLDIDQDTLDELTARGDLAERQHSRNDKQAHLFDWLPDASQSELPGHTMCDRWLKFGKAVTVADVKCPQCLDADAERRLRDAIWGW